MIAKLRNQKIIKSREDANFIYNRISYGLVKLVDTRQSLSCNK